MLYWFSFLTNYYFSTLLKLLRFKLCPMNCHPIRTTLLSLHPVPTFPFFLIWAQSYIQLQTQSPQLLLKFRVNMSQRYKLRLLRKPFLPWCGQSTFLPVLFHFFITLLGSRQWCKGHIHTTHNPEESNTGQASVVRTAAERMDCCCTNALLRKKNENPYSWMCSYLIRMAL